MIMIGHTGNNVQVDQKTSMVHSKFEPPSGVFCKMVSHHRFKFTLGGGVLSYFSRAFSDLTRLGVMKSIQPVNKYHLSLIDPRDKSCCRQSLTISAINYTDRASTFLELSTFDERYAVAKFV